MQADLPKSSLQCQHEQKINSALVVFVPLFPVMIFISLTCKAYTFILFSLNVRLFKYALTQLVHVKCNGNLLIVSYAAAGHLRDLTVIVLLK